MLPNDPAAQGAVVQALAGLRAPFGVFGCLGNHEIYTQTEDSITRLFDAAGIRILRQERTPIQSHGEVLNLIGVDYQQLQFSRDHDGHLVDRYLEGSEKLVMPDMVNILLSNNPNSFDRAAESGIDLTLAGHSHGGQLALSFINRGLALVYPETRQRMVRKTRRPALRQPRHRNHRPPHPPRRKTGDYGIGVVSK